MEEPIKCLRQKITEKFHDKCNYNRLKVGKWHLITQPPKDGKKMKRRGRRENHSRKKRSTRRKRSSRVKRGNLKKR